MKKRITVALLILMILSGVSASSAISLKAGLGIVHFKHEAEDTEKTVTSGSNGLHFQADWDLFISDSTALNLQGDLDIGKNSYINGSRMTSQAGYGIRAGVDWNAGILRLGAGLRWLVFYAGQKENKARVSAILASLNIDFVADTLLLGIEYDYPVRAWIRERGKETRELTLERVLFDTGAFFAYVGIRTTF